MLFTGQGPRNIPTTTPSFIFNTLKIGAGGWLVGMDVHSDGSKIVRTDTYGAYLLDSNGKWNQLLTSSSMPAFTYSYDATTAFILTAGVYEIRFDPQNSNIIWMHYNGWMFKSNNKGQTWTQLTNYTRDSGRQTFDNFRMGGQRMAIDPNNSNICYVGVDGVGLKFTLDGGTTWSTVSNANVPTSAARYTGIAFDPASGTTSGATNTIYVGAFNNGLYGTTNSAVTWSQLSATPLSIGHARVNSGNYYCIGASSAVSNFDSSMTNIYKWNGASLSTFRTDPTTGINGFDFNPNNSNNIVYQNGFGWTLETTNGGGTWVQRTNVSQTTLTSSDIPWLALTGAVGPGEMWFDPLVANKVWVANGVGVWTIPVNTITNPVVMTSQSANIEQLVATKIISPSSTTVVVGVQDRQTFYNSGSFLSYPTTFGNGHQTTITPCYAIDYAQSSPTTVVTNTSGPGSASISSDGGQTWTTMSNLPSASGKGAAIAASTPTNFVAIASNSSTNVQYTTNGATTAWNTSTGLSGAALGGSTVLSVPLCADKVTANTFYLYDVSNGVYRSTNGGQTWANAHGTLTGSFKVIPYLVAVPGNAGNLFFTMGYDSSSAPRPANPFYQSIDGAASVWNIVPNVQDVISVAVGATAPASSYPTVYVYGWVKVHSSPYQFGLWRSTDNCSSWTFLTDYPNGVFDNVTCMAADPSNWNIVYMGFQGSGFMYGVTS